jgi:hypothetical protein
MTADPNLEALAASMCVGSAAASFQLPPAHMPVQLPGGSAAHFALPQLISVPALGTGQH